MRNADRLVADYVLSDPERTVSTSVAEVALEAGTSVGTVVGFCRRLGLDGFSDFRIALARDLAQSGLPTSKKRGDGTILENVVRYHGECLQEVARINDQNQFEAIVRVLRGAARIEFFSMGVSYPVAYSAASKLMLVGYTAYARLDPHLQLISATQLSRRDVAFGISSSGSTRETIACLEQARRRGATTICITNAIAAPITEISDHCLFAAPSEINYFQAPLASRITQMALIDAIFVSLVQKGKRKAVERLQRASEALTRFR
jgi:DNA-binding MurR/RpiR family transcriptional regulator